jgi:inner membrane protein
MPTILSHPAVPLALAVALGSRVIPLRLVAAGVVACIVPDFDVVAFRFGINDSHDLGHRGFTHSLSFTVLLGGLAALAAPALHARRWIAFAFVTFATASHGLLDMLTNGGAGIALFWPFSSQRYFLPWPVLEVSPLGIRPFFSQRGLIVLYSEMPWVWMPCVICALGCRRLRNWR